MSEPYVAGEPLDPDDVPERIEYLISRRDERKTYEEIPLEVIGALVECAQLVKELLSDWTAYITAWEADSPRTDDGVDLDRRMREALGRVVEWRDW